MNWFSVASSLVNALKAGHELSHVGAWKKVGVVSLLLTATLSLLSALGFHIEVSTDTVNAASLFIITLINLYLHIATTKKLGFGKPVSEEQSHDSQIATAELPPIELQGHASDPTDPTTDELRNSVELAVQTKADPVVKADSAKRPSRDEGLPESPGWGDR